MFQAFQLLSLSCRLWLSSFAILVFVHDSPGWAFIRFAVSLLATQKFYFRRACDDRLILWRVQGGSIISAQSLPYRYPIFYWRLDRSPIQRRVAPIIEAFAQKDRIWWKVYSIFNFSPFSTIVVIFVIYIITYYSIKFNMLRKNW